jgi:hypothetical protein
MVFWSQKVNSSFAFKQKLFGIRDKVKDVRLSGVEKLRMTFRNLELDRG